MNTKDKNKFYNTEFFNIHSLINNSSNLFVYFTYLVGAIILYLSYLFRNLTDVFLGIGILIWLITSFLFYWNLNNLRKAIGVPHSKIIQLVIKRTFDISFSLIALILFAPLILLTAIFIKLASKGPIFINQERVGLGGYKFFIHKFRTFVSDSPLYIKDDIDLNDMDKARFKLESDPRITKIGKILIRLSIDEIPLLLNVLKGELSLIGPRPMFPYEAKYLNKKIKKIRFRVLPGITGLWQVSERKYFSFDSMIKLDIEYIKNWNIFLDIKIFLKTFKRGLLSSRGY